jgi:HAD superfamily hydrolase (TIGR01549 family)
MGKYDDIEAVFFDFLGTLIYFERLTVEESIKSILDSLKNDGLPFDYDTFYPPYKDTTQRYWDSRRGDEELYNKFWIADTLKALDVEVDPNGPVISRAVEAYFEPFHQVMKPIPGALETLKALIGRYRVGLISNFTYSPTVVRALTETGLDSYMETVVISADLGLRKPNPMIFRTAMQNLELTDPAKILFVGDDVDADIMGAVKAGMAPMLISYTLQDDYRTRLSRALESLGDGYPKEVDEIRLPIELLNLLGEED